MQRYQKRKNTNSGGHAYRGRITTFYKLMRHKPEAYNATEEKDIYVKLVYNASEHRNEYTVMVDNERIDAFFDYGKAKKLIESIVQNRVSYGWILLKGNKPSS